MKRNHLLIAIAAVLLAGLFTVAFAQQRGRMYGMRGAHMGMGPMGLRYEQMVARLKLTPEQETQVKEIVKNRVQQQKGDREAVRAARQALAKELFSDKPNQAEIQKNLGILQQDSASRLSGWVSSAQEMNKILTPEQRVEMQKMIAEKEQVSQRMRERFQQRMQEQQQEQPVQ